MCLIGVISIRAIRRRLPPGDLVAGPPVHVPGAGALLRACHRARAVLRRAPADPAGVVSGLGGHRGPGARLPASACPSCAACATTCGWPRCGRRARAWCRSSAPGGNWTGCRCPAGSSSAGASSPGAGGGRRTRTPCRPCPQPPYLRLTVKGVGDYSRRPWPGCGRGPGSRSRDRTGRSPATRSGGPGRCWSPPGSGSPPCGRCWKTCPAAARRSSCCGPAARRTWCSATKSANWSGTAGAACTSWSAPREEAGIDEVSLRRLVPDLHHRDVYVCGPEGFVAGIVALARNLGVPDEAIHHEAFAL